MKRLFIGLLVSEDATSAITAETSWLDTHQWKITPSEDLHVTALFLGDVLVSIIPDVKVIIENVASRTKPFALIGGRTRIMQPDEPTMLWLRYERNAWFERLVADLEDCFKKIGSWEKRKNFNRPKNQTQIPHITLARVRGGGMLDSLMPPFESHKKMETYTARKIALYSSEYDKKNDVTACEKLEEWTLGSSA